MQEDPTITLSRRPVQQQTGGADCGIFAIAYAYHAARWYKVETINFDQARMRQHLNCFEKELLSPFPVLDQKPRRCRLKRFIITLYCKCRMLASVDDNMIQCDICAKWYHFKCVSVASVSQTWYCCQYFFLFLTHAMYTLWFLYCIYICQQWGVPNILAYLVWGCQLS